MSRGKTEKFTKTCKKNHDDTYQNIKWTNTNFVSKRAPADCPGDGSDVVRTPHVLCWQVKNKSKQNLYKGSARLILI